MTNKNVITTIVVALVVGGIGFFGGMKYGQSRALSPQVLQSMTQAQRQQLFSSFSGGQGGGAGGAGFGGRRNGGAGSQGGAGFVNGQVISKDDKSITVKLNSGGSKIVFYSSTTNVGKTVQGSASDLAVGDNVVVNGTANSDGSVTAQNVQIRPAMPQGQPNPQ